MNIEAIIYDNVYKKSYNISDSIGDIQIQSWLEEQPGKCTFTVYKSSTLAFWEGATISITIDGKGVFMGYIQKKERDSDVQIIKCTAYDQLLYWKAKHFENISGKTCDQIFEFLCTDQKFLYGEKPLSYEVIDRSDYICTPRIADNETMYDTQKQAFWDTLIYSHERFIVRDNFGVLNHVNIKSLRTNLIFGDRSGINNFSYSSDISQNTYNAIVLYKDNAETKEREEYKFIDSTTFKRWGILQLYQNVNENMNTAQISQKGENLLKYYDVVNRSLKLDCIGDFNVFAGAIIRCAISDLGDLSINSDLLVTECTHKITSDEHTMSLRVELVIP